MRQVLASDIISCGNDEKSVVSVRPNASSFFALAISFIDGRKAAILVFSGIHSNKVNWC